MLDFVLAFSSVDVSHFGEFCQNWMAYWRAKGERDSLSTRKITSTGDVLFWAV
jgi:hypothetical protein